MVERKPAEMVWDWELGQWGPGAQPLPDQGFRGTKSPEADNMLYLSSIRCKYWPRGRIQKIIFHNFLGGHVHVAPPLEVINTANY